MPNLFSLAATKLAFINDGGKRLRGCVWVTSADPCRMGGIEGVGMVEAEYVGRLLRMVCNLLLMPVCVWICWRWGTSMGAEQVIMRTLC